MSCLTSLSDAIMALGFLNSKHKYVHSYVSSFESFDFLKRKIK